VFDYIFRDRRQRKVDEEAVGFLMESIKALLILLVLVGAATALIAGLAIYYRKRPQHTQSKVVDKTKSAAIANPLPALPGSQRAVSEGVKTVVQRKTPPNVQSTIIEEIQTTPVEETQATATEETKPIGTEQTQTQGVEKAQPEGDKKPEVPAKRGPREPIKRGGKPRGPDNKGLENKGTQENRRRLPRPEIICRKRERQWVLALEVPEELLEKADLKVLQKGSPLTQDELGGTFGCLKSVHDEVVVQWNESGVVQEARVELNQKDYLLFKLSGQNLDQGRLVKSPSSGSYLVIVPDTWERDETLSGPPPVLPEPVSLACYKAHFFDLDKSGNSKIAFCCPDEQPLVIDARSPRFELIGTQLEDASENIGPLFSDTPPRIRAKNTEAWKNVKTIVVGEEGSGRRKFTPDADQVEQELPSEVSQRKSGWYFLRFYDTNDGLIESMDFRWIADLRAINVPRPKPFPSEDGHKSAQVELIHSKECVVKPADEHTNIQIKVNQDGTVLIVPPDPTCDLSRWLAFPKNGPPVKLAVLVERIWWALAEEDTTPSDSDWTDKPIEVSRADFAATSSKALWLRLPRRGWVNRVLAGFEWSKARPYDVRVEENTIAIPLRDYSDSQEVGNQTWKYDFCTWIEGEGRKYDGVVAILPASPPSQVVSLPRQWVGFGRKKKAIAKAIMQSGPGEIKINGRPVDDYFSHAPNKAKRFLERLRNLEKVRKVLSQVTVTVTIRGSSPTTTQQAKAVAHAIARALMSHDSRLKPILRQAGFGGVKMNAFQADRRFKQ